MNHWLLTQYLLISAMPLVTDAERLPEVTREYGAWWDVARQIARRRFRRAAAPDHQAWELTTLAELELLGAVYGHSEFDKERAAQEITHLCHQMRELVPVDSFPIFSAIRQFRQYVDSWPRPEWTPLAKSAIDALTGDAIK